PEDLVDLGAVDRLALEEGLGHLVEHLEVAAQEELRALVGLEQEAAHLGVDLDGGLLGVVDLLREVAAEEDLLFLLAEGHRPELVAHTPLAHHLVRQLGGALDVVARPGRHAAERELLGRAPTEEDGELAEEVVLRVGVPVVERHLLRQPEGHAARNDGHLVHRVGARHELRHQRVARLVWTFRMPSRPCTSGRGTTTRRSNRPGRRSAGSRTSGRLVAAIRMTPSLVSKPSISTSSWLSVCSRSSCPPPRPAPRWRPTASISSMKMMQGAFFFPCTKRSRTREAPTPTNISTKSEPEMEKKGTPASPAMARARSVLPVPGAPTSSTPFGMRPPSLVNFFGSFRKAMISSSSSLASSIPAKIGRAHV